MNLPATVTEEQFLAALQQVSAVLSAKHKFGGHDAEDIAQIVAVHAIEALPRYDLSKGNLEGFLYRHCSNRLLNDRRALGFRTDPPCRVCFDRARGFGDGHHDGSTCPVFDAWWARRRTRASLDSPTHFDRVESVEQESRRAWADSTVESKAAAKELMDLVDAGMPLDLRADFLRMRAGVTLETPRRERVLKAARRILDDPRLYDGQRSNDTSEERDDEFDAADDANE